jgi:hypothetical protein
MRKSLWIMLAVILVAFGAPNAHADAFTADITCTTTQPAVDCVASSSAITNFPSPSPFDFTLSHFNSGNLLAQFVLAAELATQDQPGDVYQFTLDPTNGNEAFSDFTQTGVNLFANNACTTGGFDCGTIAFVPVATPEPSSAALMLFGVGLAFAMRKRVGQRLPQAS